MRVVRLASETDFSGWRRAARELRCEGVAPEEAVWTVDADLFGAPPPSTGRLAPGVGFTVPRDFLPLAQNVILHRSGERLALLYRLLWRFADQPDLLDNPADADVAKARDLAKAVSRASHKMKAFVRFREVEGEDEPAYVAWFEPAHRVAEKTAPFFVERFANMRFSILTPDACLHWDKVALTVGPGADPADAPREDALEEYWRTYYASIFNPARLKPAAMQKEMPKRYWRNLPEASLIPELIAAAEARTAEMVAKGPTVPDRRIVRAAIRRERDAPFATDIPSTLEEVRAGVAVCRRCDLWRDATQGVPGEGRAAARIMLVGEQPGDQEDLAGKPFVGPAGAVLDRALAQAGVPRDQLYVTNAVKHFKHEPRGKRRIHKTPDAGEVNACRFWLEAERGIIRPRVVVALGATAALSVFGKTTPIAKNRGQALQLPDQSQAVVTYHPSAILRVPDEAAKKTMFEALAEDLAFAAQLAA